MVIASLKTLTSSFDMESVVLLVVVLLLTIVWIRRPRNLPPGPRAWPIIGNARDFQKGHLHQVFTGWSKQYGSVVSVRMGPRLAIVLNDINVVTEAMFKQADCFSGRYVAPQFGILLSVKGSFVLSNGNVWKERRRFGLSAMRSLGMGKRSLEHKINEEARHLLQSFDTEGEKPFDPEHAILNAVSNIICMISFGYRFEYSDPKFAHLLKLAKTSLASSSSAMIGNLFPFLFYTPMYNTVRRRLGKIANFIQGIVQEHWESFDPNNIRDIIDMCIMEIKQQKQNRKVGDETTLCKEDMWRGIYDLFLAGTGTTANAMMWILLYMAIYPDVQKKVQNDIDDVIGSDRQTTSEDRDQMIYTNAVLMEILRVRPVTPVILPRETNHETNFMGYTIPAKTIVYINAWAVLNDPKCWKDPEIFNPTRFLSKDRKTLAKNEAFMPFGLGRRVCLGETVAKMELFLFSANLLQRFTFSLPADKQCPSVEGISGMTFGPHPYEIVATKR